MKLFFVCNSSPSQFIKWLGDEASDIKSKPTKRCTGILLMLGYSANRMAIKFVEDSSAKVVIFDGPLMAMSMTNSNLLDIKRTATPPYYGIEFSKLNRKIWQTGQDSKLKVVRYDHTANIIAALESKSLLNSLMTAIYTLASASQKQVKVALINWLFFDGKPKNLELLLSSLSDRVRITHNASEQLMTIMQTDLAVTYIAALKQKGNINDVAADYEISDYDLRYMNTVKITRSEYLTILYGSQQ